MPHVWSAPSAPPSSTAGTAIRRSCGTNAACVERSIRSAIEGGWARFTPEQRRQYFGSLFDACEKAPSNVPFLTAMTEFVEQQCCREERLGF